MDKKQTAVEWVIEQIQTFEFTHLDRNRILEQAKAMETEQIIDANNMGYSACKRHTDETAEQYYTSTYG
jgi:hypothetical protein